MPRSYSLEELGATYHGFWGPVMGSVEEQNVVLPLSHLLGPRNLSRKDSLGVLSGTERGGNGAGSTQRPFLKATVFLSQLCNQNVASAWRLLLIKLTKRKRDRKETRSRKLVCL